MLSQEAKQRDFDSGVTLLEAVSNEPCNRNIWLDGLFNKWFRLNTLYDILDVRANKVQFIANESQADLYQAGHSRSVVLKARQLGFTTFKMIEKLDECLFVNNYHAACIAHTLDAVKDIFDNKIKFAYENLNHEFIEDLTGGQFLLPKPQIDRANAYKFSNGSRFSVGTGYRSGTLQSLHVSEFGKICRKTPEKAREIVTGSFEAVSEDGEITVESTAEGREGRFYEMVKLASSKQIFGVLDFKLRFYAWHENSRYALAGGVINERLIPYFEELEFKHGIPLTDSQKRWYSAKEEVLGDDIYREYPSYPEEAFKVAIEGAYYAREFADIYKSGRIGEPLNKNIADVCTAWDIGTGDSTAIWFYHHVGNELHLIDYYENSGFGLEHYLKVLSEKGYAYKAHYGPHDMDNRQFASKAKTLRDLAKEGLECDGKVYKANFTIVPKIGINDGIAHSRRTLARCYFYEEETQQGVKCLENYRKEWDEKNGCWKDNPKHDWSSHGADAFRYLSVVENQVKPVTRMTNNPFS